MAKDGSKVREKPLALCGSRFRIQPCKIRKQHSALRGSKVRKQPLVLKRPSSPAADIIAMASAFISRYGGQPHEKQISIGRKIKQRLSSCHDQALTDLLHGAPIITAHLQQNIDAYLSANTSQHMHLWANQMRHKYSKSPLKPSLFADALLAHAPIGQPRKTVLQQKPDSRSDTILDQQIFMDGAIPYALWTSASGEKVRFTPPQVANWVYQALVDVTREIQKLLHGSACFDQHGNAAGSGEGEVVLWWGSHLGSIRDQGMIAWDYDGDLAVFITEDCNFDNIWHLASKPLAALGYRLSTHGSKFRAGPIDPLCWAPYKELYQQVREKNPSASRSDNMHTVAELWKK